MKNSLPEALDDIRNESVEKASSLRLNAAILPPVNSTRDPVTSPLSFSLSTSPTLT